jgi:hypothetical protein
MEVIRALLQQPKIVGGTGLAAQAEAPDLTEAEMRGALGKLDPLWGQLFPAGQARIIRLLVERVVVSPAGADIQLRWRDWPAWSAISMSRALRYRERRHERGDQRYGPGAAGHPAASRTEDDCHAGRRAGCAGSDHACRPSADEGAGPSIPLPASAG